MAYSIERVLIVGICRYETGRGASIERKHDVIGKLESVNATELAKTRDVRKATTANVEKQGRDIE